MLCRVCKAHYPSVGGKRAWIDVGCKTLRRDKVLEHEASEIHKLSVRSAVMSDEMKSTASQQKSTAVDVVTDALRIVCFIVDHNLPLSLFGPLVQLASTLGAPNISKMHVGKNATYTSWESVQGFVSALSREVRADVMADIKASPAYAVMADEVCDVTSDKHLALVCRYVTPAAEISTALLDDVVIPNGRAETIVNEVKKVIAAAELDPLKMAPFGSDGASTFAGKKSGVGVRLKEVNPSLIFQHCRDHRLALACKQSYSKIKVINKTDELLNNLHKYYKYSCVHNANLKSVQAAFGQPQLRIKQAKHHRWLSHNQAVASLVRSYTYVTMMCTFIIFKVICCM